MKNAIDVLTKNAKSDEKTTEHLIGYKTRLSGIYNALGKYDLSLKEGKEAENLLKTRASMNNNSFCNHGIILRERGLSHLRLNKVNEAYDYFMQAKEIFSKAMISDYLFRLKMHEAEALIRMDRLDEAFMACEEIFAMRNRERNNYCDLFFNTCYYHAAVIKHRQGNAKAALEYFREFFLSMKELCRKIVPEAEYYELIKQNAFDGNDMRACFENSLKVFEAIYWKDYEFTKYYVEENLRNHFY
jgi:tetratricopeptide (TPR) repeat protein